jgi:hypothetical protein
MTEREVKACPDDFKEIGPLPVGTILRDWHDDGVRIIITRGPLHPCVYLGIPLDHPLAGHDYENLPIDCHGGLTFADKGDGKYRPKGYYWYGYDYGHCNDFMFCDHPSTQRLDGKKWTVKEIVDDAWRATWDLKKLMRLCRL